MLVYLVHMPRSKKTAETRTDLWLVVYQPNCDSYILISSLLVDMLCNNHFDHQTTKLNISMILSLLKRRN